MKQQTIEIIVDNREQLPYSFELYEDVQTIFGTLKSGDYTLKGFENEIIIERKSMTDLLQSITADRKRFEKEIQRLSQFRKAFVVVENDIDSCIEYIKNNRKYSSEVLLSTVVSWNIRYNIQWLFLKNRQICERAVYKIFQMFVKNNCEAGIPV